MNKKIFNSIISLMLAVVCMAAVACTEKDKDTTTSSGTIKVDPLTLTGLDSKYNPDKANIKQMSGSIDLVLDFDGSVAGWEALATEYERLQSGEVLVNINKNNTGDAYKRKLNSEAQTPEKSEWDIVQGNLLDGNVGDYCVDMYQYLYSPNAYAGASNEAWLDVLETNAYEMATVESNSTYIMNTENINTAWFVNTVALQKAGEKGYKNKNGEVGTPVTWDDLVELLRCMKEAGYANPLGLSLDTASVESNQFTWLVRVYGDYYSRDDYANILKDGTNYVYDPADTNPDRFVNESTLMRSRLYSCILDDSESNKDYYIGATSGKFKDYLEQFAKLKPYISSFASTTSQEEMRNRFGTQSKGTDSPQIMLDYLGQGLFFASSETSSFKVDFFDYPSMTSDYITDGRIVRDVGGSGGWLSVFKKGNKSQIELNVDFIKFVMSPYGQTIYYEALQKAEYYPRGLTLVKNDTVAIPDSWKDFFQSDKVTFSGLVDTNEFVRNLYRSFGGITEAATSLQTIYTDFLTKSSYSVDNFANDWRSALVNAWEKLAAKSSWKLNSTNKTLIDRSKELK